VEWAYVIEEFPLGTGGAIRGSFRRYRDDAVLVVNGNSFLDLDVGQAQAHRRRKRTPMIICREVSDTARYDLRP
jgi:D-glycero-alpha-D-manno-heptose 1-phosphate guanylyltransferase